MINELTPHSQGNGFIIVRQVQVVGKFCTDSTGRRQRVVTEGTTGLQIDKYNYITVSVKLEMPLERNRNCCDYYKKYCLLNSFNINKSLIAIICTIKAK